jgi:hypothetical protein
MLLPNIPVRHCDWDICRYLDVFCVVGLPNESLRLYFAFTNNVPDNLCVPVFVKLGADLNKVHCNSETNICETLLERYIFVICSYDTVPKRMPKLRTEKAFVTLRKLHKYVLC